MKQKIYFSLLLISFFIVSSQTTVNAQCTCSGIVNTNGTTVTWVSGCHFNSVFSGQNILINGVTYFDSTVTSSTSLTLRTSAGTQTGVSFSYSYNTLATILNPSIAKVCEGKCITITSYVGGGVPPYTLFWSTGVSGNPITACPLVDTSYSVTITDANSCTISASKTVTVYPLPVVTVSPDTAFCIGYSTQLSSSGGISCSWSPPTGLSTTAGCIVAATPTTTTTYTVTVADNNGCTNTAITTVTVNPHPPAPVITCNTDTLAFTPDSSYISYQWYYNGSVIPGATDSFYVATQLGIYAVAVTDHNGCMALTETFCLSNIGINNYTDENIISISPNPFTNSFVLTMHGGIGNERNILLGIYNVLGEEIRTVAIEKEKTIISRKDMADGIYFYRIMRDGVAVHSGKLVVQ